MYTCKTNMGPIVTLNVTDDSLNEMILVEFNVVSFPHRLQKSCLVIAYMSVTR